MNISEEDKLFGTNRIPQNLIRIWVRLVLDNLIYQCSINGARLEELALRKAKKTIDDPPPDHPHRREGDQR